jgi:uncharacterized protein with von Willebrand factor type A (vWA) domain
LIISKLKDFSIATARMMPVIILADVSGSMTAYGKLAARNRAIADLMLTRSQPGLEWFGASVRGRSHIHQSRPNEDAWMGMSGAFGTAIVISDGMG